MRPVIPLGIGLCALLSASIAGCHSTKAAPSDLDGLAHWYWQHYDGTSPVDNTTGADTDVVGATINLDAAIQAANAANQPSGTLTDLSDDEQAQITLDQPADVSLAAGIYVEDTLDCTLDQINRITIDLNQDQLYPDAYDTYKRTYTSDSGAFTTGVTPYLTWVSNIDATVLGAAYHEDVDGGARSIVDDGTVSGSFGDAFMSRVVLISPAVYVDTSTSDSFDQDYQLEIYYPISDTSVQHFYALWRQYDYGHGLDQDSATAQSLMIGKLFDFDKSNTAICATGF